MNSPIGESFPLQEREKYSERSLKVGFVLRLLSDTTPPKLKGGENDEKSTTLLERAVYCYFARYTCISYWKKIRVCIGKRSYK